MWEQVQAAENMLNAVLKKQESLSENIEVYHLLVYTAKLLLQAHKSLARDIAATAADDGQSSSSDSYLEDYIDESGQRVIVVEYPKVQLTLAN